MPLLACPRCASRLIYARDIAGTGSHVVLARRCPDCEHRDSVTTTATAASAWLDRDARLATRLSTAIDAVSVARRVAASSTARTFSKSKATYRRQRQPEF